MPLKYTKSNDIEAMNIFKFIGGTAPILDKPAFIEMDYGTASHQSSIMMRNNQTALTPFHRPRVEPAILASSATNSQHWNMSYGRGWRS